MRWLWDWERGAWDWVVERIETTVDSRAFRRAVGQFVTGVTVIAIELDGEIRAMTANSFTPLSLEPPLLHRR
jgi:flavin reductase (DIM6/NTAB) family NADH-FMN oxidoreductase RutF